MIGYPVERVLVGLHKDLPLLHRDFGAQPCEAGHGPSASNDPRDPRKVSCDVFIAAGRQIDISTALWCTEQVVRSRKAPAYAVA